MKSLALALPIAAVMLVAACPSKVTTPMAVDAGDAHAAHAAVPLVAAAAGAYTCPMHPEVVSDAPGKCPKCGMALVSTAPQSPVTVSVSTSPAQPKAGAKTKITLEMKSDGARLAAFDVVHEKKLHLLMVTPDLSWFAHEHPELQPDGTFVLEFAFPKGGTYRLFSDFKATDRAGAVLSTDVVVDGPPTPPQPLVATDLKAPRAVDGFEVRLTSPAPVAGVEKQLTFVVMKDKKPVADLEPYLGAMGHLVVLGSDAKTFLHAHPAEHGHDAASKHGALDAHAAKDHVHPAGTPAHEHQSAGAPGVVSFATTFPRPGFYKAWAQFQVKGKPIIADFTLDVPAASVGAPLDAHP